MQCKFTFTQRLTFFRRVYTTNKMTRVTTTVTKMRLLGSHIQVHYGNFHNALSADFKAGYFFSQTYCHGL